MSFTSLSKRETNMVLLGIMLSVLLAALDSSIVGTAMPAIIADLKGMEHYSWPFTAYMLLSTLVIPIAGKLADTYGRKLIMLIGIIVFLVASALCGMAQTMMQLIVFRGLQGLGGGILMSGAFTIIGEMYTPRERGKYMGLVASMFGLASVLGPSLGGFITDQFSWPWIFYVNLPVGIVAFITIFSALPSHLAARKHDKIDFAGLFTFILAITPLLLAFTWGGNEYAWDSVVIIGMLVLSMAMLITFIFVERRAENPIIPPMLFSNKIFNVAIVATFMGSVTMFGAVIFLPLFAQAIMGKTASQTGTVITPLTLSFVVAAIISGRVISATGRYKFIAITGFSLAIVGTLLLTLLKEDTSDFQLIGTLIILGLGLGATTPTFNLAVQNAFSQKDLGVVTSAIQFFRNMGATMGAALLGAVMFSNVRNSMGAYLSNNKGIPQNVVAMLQNPSKMNDPDNMKIISSSLPPAQVQNLFSAYHVALSQAIHAAFYVSIGAATLALLFSLFLKEIPLRSKDEEHVAVPALDQ